MLETNVLSLRFTSWKVSSPEKSQEHQVDKFSCCSMLTLDRINVLATYVTALLTKL